MRFFRRILSHSIAGPAALALISASVFAGVTMLVLDTPPFRSSSFATFHTSTSLDSTVEDTEESLNGDDTLDESTDTDDSIEDETLDDDDTSLDETEETLNDTQDSLDDTADGDVLDDTVDETDDDTNDTGDTLSDSDVFFSSDVERGATTDSARTSGEVDTQPAAAESTTVSDVMNRYAETTGRERLAARRGILVEQDLDDDGISDYDELYLYGTDPRDPHTAKSEMTDGELLLSGLNPHAADGRPIAYEDPRVASVTPTDTYRVTDITSRLSAGESDGVVFRGTAPPNIFVTLYIFSTPIVVTTKANESGEWIYRLDRELPDGEHEMYVATVDNSGKILARSEATPFTLQAGSVQLGAEQAADSKEGVGIGGFFVDNFIAVTGFILAFAFLVTVLVIGLRPWIQTVRET